MYPPVSLRNAKLALSTSHAHLWKPGGSLKKCVFCAEEVQDEAKVCRYCGRSFLDRAREISHSEGDYALGTTDQSYAIWSVSAGGSPKEEFSPDEAGWSRAWGRWQEVHGRASLAESSVPEGKGFTGGAGTNRKATASLILGILWFAGIGSLAAIVLGLLAVREVTASDGLQSGKGVAIAGLVLGVLGVLMSLSSWLF